MELLNFATLNFDLQLCTLYFVLFLESCLAALQAPIIMMSQNRQAASDRIDAKHDYEVNVKAEIEILALHSKLDEMREDKWAELVKMQEQQLALLAQLLDREGGAGRGTV